MSYHVNPPFLARGAPFGNLVGTQGPNRGTRVRISILNVAYFTVTFPGTVSSVRFVEASSFSYFSQSRDKISMICLPYFLFEYLVIFVPSVLALPCNIVRPVNDKMFPYP